MRAEKQREERFLRFFLAGVANAVFPTFTNSIQRGVAMGDTTELVRVFVQNFIRSDKRERCFFQLVGKSRRRFTDDLNHK